ncbi:MAG TPA: peptide-methionine (S)-S-oxide reductase MsrA [Bacteroidia bacterium]|nr:peptide-methionine (S)-S-oxide reductase MsrA [Bacteroidia bacterium]
MKKSLNNFVKSIFLFTVLTSCAAPKEKPITVMDTANSDTLTEPRIDTVTFGEGCFWCTEAFFQELEGVVSVTSGYSGGTVPNPSYEQVCTGLTGHAEVCQIVFDTTKISFVELLQAFWKTHNPTTLNRAGNDVGTQYRSVIFYHNLRQKTLAEEYKQKLNASGAWKDPVITEISPYKNFYKAENYHQDYFKLNGHEPYCQYVIAPKVAEFRKVFKDELKNKN